MPKPSKTPQTIAVFDFDETLITIDSLPDFFLRSFGLKQLLIKGPSFLPTLVRFKLGLISNTIAKEALLRTFLVDVSPQAFTDLCVDYQARLISKTNPVALKRLRWHQRQGHTVIVMSASLEDWVKPWAKQYGVGTVIASRLEITKGRITGKLKGLNCYGPEKVVRLLAEFPHRDTYRLYVYGDGKSDAEILAFSDEPFLKRFS